MYNANTTDTYTTYKNLTVGLFRDVRANDTNVTAVRNEHKEYSHALYMIGHIMFAVAFLFISSWRYHPIVLRVLVTLGYISLIVWSCLYTCFLDYFLWSLVLVLVNILYCMYFLYKFSPVNLDVRLVPLFSKVFMPLLVDKQLLKDLTSLGEITDFGENGNYAVEYETPCNEYIAMVITGKFNVTSGGTLLHSIVADQFLDSLEYETVNLDKQQQFYQVTISAVEESQIIRWNINVFREFLGKRPHLGQVIANIMGKDITSKLYKIQEKLARGRKAQRRASFQPSMLMFDLRNGLVASPSTAGSIDEEIQQYFKERNIQPTEISVHTLQGSYSSHGGSACSHRSRSRSPAIIRVYAPDANPNDVFLHNN